MELEVAQADVLRSLYRLGVLSYDDVDKLIDILTVRLLSRQLNIKEDI
jgi:hypothetical protein